MIELQHEVREPDPLCEGDDPCVCRALEQARRQAFSLAAMVMRDKCIRTVGWVGEEYRTPADVIEAITAALGKIKP